MNNLDKSLTLGTFKDYIKQYASQIDILIKMSQPFAIVGAYGLRKGILCRYIQKLPAQKYIVNIVDLEAFDDIDEAKLYRLILYTLGLEIQHKFEDAGDVGDEFYWQLSKYIDQHADKKLIIIIRQANKLMRVDDTVLNRLNKYVYSHKTQLLVIGSGTPKLINHPSDALRSLFSNTYIYMSPLDNKSAVRLIKQLTVNYDISIPRFSEKVLKLTHNVHGAITFLCALVVQHKPSDINEKFLFKVVYTDPKLKLFIDECLDALTQDQIRIIHNYCLHHQVRKIDEQTNAFENLLKLNIFYKSGKTYTFIYEMFSGYMLHILNKINLPTHSSNQETLAYDQINFELGKNVILTPEESKLMELLVRKRGKFASLAEITAHIWPNSNKYSIYAISKLVSRTRKSVIKNTDWRCSIKTKYKKGYYLAC